MPECYPLVSVVIPTHGRARLLLRLLDSLLSQTLNPDQFEILVVHNYSNDGTEEQVAKWVEDHSVQLRYFRKNYKGPAASRDFGAREARGEFIAFIDDDCLASRDWLKKGVGAFPNDNVGLVQGKTLPVPDQPRHLLEKTVCIEGSSIFFETCNIIYRKSAFLEVGGFSPEFLEKFYGEDTDLGWKIRQAGFEMSFCQEAIVYHEVFKVSFWQWLKEPLFFENIPYLAKKFPELRDHMCAHYFLTSDTAMFYLFMVGVLAALFIDPFLGAIIAAPYFVHRYRNGSHMRNPFLKLLRIVFGLPRAFLMWWTLLKGSICARSVLL